MADRKICFAALPGACPAIWPLASGHGGGAVMGEDVVTRTILLNGLDPGQDAVGMEVPFLAPRTLPRLSHKTGAADSSAQTAYDSAQSLVVLLPIGRFDDGVWSPIIEKLVADAGAMRRETILAWSGIEPFLAPFGRRASDLWHDPRLLPGLLAVLERSARSLAAILSDLPSSDGAPAVRKGLIRVETGKVGIPDRISLALV